MGLIGRLLKSILKKCKCRFKSSCICNTDIDLDINEIEENSNTITHKFETIIQNGIKMTSI